MRRIQELLDSLEKERREDLRSFIMSVVKKLLPDPKELRELAQLVNIDRLRSVEDGEVLSEDFKRIETKLLKWAEIMEVYLDNETKQER